MARRKKEEPAAPEVVADDAAENGDGDITTWPWNLDRNTWPIVIPVPLSDERRVELSHEIADVQKQRAAAEREIATLKTQVKAWVGQLEAINEVLVRSREERTVEASRKDYYNESSRVVVSVYSFNGAIIRRDRLDHYQADDRIRVALDDKQLDLLTREE